MQLTKDEIDALLPEPAATNQPCIHTTTDRWAMQLVAHANWPVGTTFFTRDQLTAFAAAVIAAHTAKVLGDVEPVAWQKADRQATEDGFAIIGWLPCTKHEYNALLIPKRALYPAHTVAALAARVAELEKDAGRLDAVERNRFELTPLEGGGWDVSQYHSETCDSQLFAVGELTARAAIDSAALAAKGQA
mgnify:CR=1 FL=1